MTAVEFDEHALSKATPTTNTAKNFFIYLPLLS